MFPVTMAKYRKPRILFVDDEASIRLTLPRVLAKFFDVTSAGTPEDALTEIQSEQFDMLLSDLNLPQSNAGFTVIEAMRKAQLIASISFSPDIPQMKAFN